MSNKKSTFDNIWEKIGGRKLAAYFLGLITLCVLASLGMFNETVMYGLLGLATTFSGGNGIEHIAKALKRPTALLEGPEEESVKEEPVKKE